MLVCGWGKGCVIAKFDRDRRRLVNRQMVRVLIGGKSDVTLRKWIEEGLFPQPKVGPDGRHTWTLGEVLDWIDGRPRRGVPEQEEASAA